MKGLVITLILLAFPFSVGIHSVQAKGTLGCCIESLNKIIQPIAEKVTDPLKPIADAAGDLSDQVVQPVAETVTDTLKPITEAVGELTDQVVQPVTETVTDTLRPITDAASGLTDKVVQPVVKTVTDPLKPIADEVGELTNEAVQPVAEIVTNSQKPFAEDVGVKSELYLDLSPAENDYADKSPTPIDRPLDIIPSPPPLLAVASRLETAEGLYSAAIQSIPKPTLLLSKEKGHQAANMNSSNTFISTKTSQFPEREPFPTIPFSEPTLPPSSSTVGSLLPLPASAKNGNAKSSYAGSDFKAVLIDKSDPMIPCSRMSWHFRIRHYLSWSHAPPLRPPVASDLDD